MAVAVGSAAIRAAVLPAGCLVSQLTFRFAFWTIRLQHSGESAIEGSGLFLREHWRGQSA